MDKNPNSTDFVKPIKSREIWYDVDVTPVYAPDWYYHPLHQWALKKVGGEG